MATAASIDYIVMENAFVLDLESHSSVKGGGTVASFDSNVSFFG